MSAHLEFVEKNVAYAESFDKGHLPVPPAKKLLIGSSLHLLPRIYLYRSSPQLLVWMRGLSE